MNFEFELPAKAETLNVRLRKHEMAEHRAKKLEIRAVKECMPRALLQPILRVTLTRRGPKELDKLDNLNGSLKTYRDAIARVMNFDDKSPLVDWVYAQEIGPYAVRVRVEAIHGVTQQPLKVVPGSAPAAEILEFIATNSKKRKAKKKAEAKKPKRNVLSAEFLRDFATPATYRPGKP